MLIQCELIDPPAGHSSPSSRSVRLPHQQSSQYIYNRKPTIITTRPHHLSKSLAQPVIRLLSLIPIIKQQRRTIRSPAIRIAQAPHRHTHTIRHIRTSPHRCLIITRRRTLDIQLRDCALVDDGAQRLQRAGKSPMGQLLARWLCEPIPSMGTPAATQAETLEIMAAVLVYEALSRL